MAETSPQSAELDAQIAKLKKAVLYWRGWDAEYEALKEELEELADNEEDQVRRLRDEYEGEVVTKKDLDEIFGSETVKSRIQIINILDRRIDYVSDNIRTLQKQLDALEQRKMNQDGDELLEDVGGDDGQLTEIIEQLDEDDNVLSYRLNTPSNTLPRVADALEKAGIKDVPETVTEKPASSGASSQRSKPTAHSSSATPTEAAVPPKPSPKTQVVEEPELSEAAKGKEPENAKPAISRNAQRVEQIMDSAKQQEGILKDNPIIPDDESEEDAALRQEMLKYSMGEVGAIVAQMDIEEMGDDDYEFDYSDEELEDDDENEDAYGRYQGRVITDDYRERMLELEKKLGIKSRFTAAAERQAEEEEEEEESDEEDAKGLTEGIGRIKISQNPVATPSADKPEPTKSIVKERGESASPKPKSKGVRFADSLDIAPEDEPVRETNSAVVQERAPIVEPLNETIVERRQPREQSGDKPARPLSKFKQAQAAKAAAAAAASPAMPEDLKEKTLADKLFERETTSEPVPPDEFDDSMIRDEVADEYQRMRRKFIQRDGGFLKEDDRAIRPLDEEHGGPKTMSRFKAARLSKQ